MSHQTALRNLRWAAAQTTLVLVVLLATNPSWAAEFTIGAGSSVNLGTGLLDLGCADLTVDGTLSTGAVGIDSARDIVISAGGVLNGDSATIQVTGDWDNGSGGTFNAGTGTVGLMDGCSVASAVVSGSTSFANLDMTTTSGKLWSFVAGTTQTITSSLTLLGASGNLLQMRSTLVGSSASLNLQGTGGGDFVDVDDIDASAGNQINAGVNSLLGPNTPGWLLASAIPMLPTAALVVLLVALAWVILRRSRVALFT